mgnify:CR=1 FL=1
MSHEYAPHGFIGLFTPQANTCVEAECAILLPPGIGSLASRLISARATIEERLVDYIDTLESKALEFANVPLRALGFACTGPSYLAGRDREDDLLARLSDQLNCHVTSSAVAVVDALRALGAERIALVSPYSDALTQSSIAYWNSRGFSVGPGTHHARHLAKREQEVDIHGTAHRKPCLYPCLVSISNRYDKLAYEFHTAG